MPKYRRFNPKVQEEITARATDANGVIRCEICHLALTGKKVEIDHIIAESLVPDYKKDKPLTAAEGQLLGECCHRGPDGKTKKDVAAAAKTKRQKNRHVGIKTKKAKPIQSQCFAKTEKHRAIDKSAVPELPRPSLFRKAG